MKIFTCRTYEELSEKAANDLIESVRAVDQPLICTASGDSPAGLYRQLVQKVRRKEVDIKEWSFIGLDEWVGMNGNDEGSCRYHLDHQLFFPLKIEKVHFFDGRAKDLQKECESTENFIREQHGIDVAIIGLGMNGHVGMNEPGTAVDSRSHIAIIDRLTQQTGQKYFKKEQKLTHGLTLGIADLLEARKIILVVSGSHKAQIVQKTLEEKISEEIPATYLRNHPDISIYLDHEAARLISHVN